MGTNGRGTTRHATYAQLVRRHPLRPVRSDGERDAALAVVDGLLGRGSGLSADEEDYLEVLALLVQQYEDERHPAAPASDARTLGHLLESRGVSLRRVARETGIAASTLSAVLRGRRELTRAHVAALAAFFDVRPALFLG